MSLRRKENRAIVRLHRMFLGAGADILEEIAGFIKKGKGKTPLLLAFVKENICGIRERTAGKTTIRTEGKYHSLLDIFGSLNNEYFGGRLSCLITWGAGRLRYAVRKRTLGSYSSRTNTIRINPVLDRKTTPEYFVGFVVYHEMLHADMKIETKNGRRLVHSKVFKQREKLFRHYEKAIAWEKKGVG